MSETLARLEGVFRQVFEDDKLALARGTSAADIASWDSLMHVALVINVEKEFQVKFTSAEVAGFRNVGELMDLVEARVAS